MLRNYTQVFTVSARMYKTIDNQLPSPIFDSHIRKRKVSKRRRPVAATPVKSVNESIKWHSSHLLCHQNREPSLSSRYNERRPQQVVSYFPTFSEKKYSF